MKKRTVEPLPLPLSKNIKNTMDKIFPKNIPSPNLYRIVAKNEPLFKELIESEFIGKTGLFDRKRLSPELREKIILRTCVATKNEYEFNLHVDTISQKMGLTIKQIEDMKKPNLNLDYWNKEDIALFDMIDSLVKQIKVSDTVFDNVSRYYNESLLIEIIHIIGLYTGVAMLVAFCNPQFDNYKNLK